MVKSSKLTAVSLNQTPVDQNPKSSRKPSAELRGRQVSDISNQSICNLILQKMDYISTTRGDNNRVFINHTNTHSYLGLVIQHYFLCRNEALKSSNERASLTTATSHNNKQKETSTKTLRANKSTISPVERINESDYQNPLVLLSEVATSTAT